MELFLAVHVGRIRRETYRHNGETFRLAEHRTTSLGTRVGKVAFRRPVGRRADAPRATCDLPIDRELGLCSGFSLGVVQDLARLASQMAFAAARSTFREVYAWAPSPRALLRMIDAVGAHARSFPEGAAAPADDGAILVIQVDGRGAPMITDVEHQRRRQPHAPRATGVPRRSTRRLRRRQRPRPRRTKGAKSKNAKVAFVGVLYTVQPTPAGVEGPINKRVIATFASHEALFIWLRREADKRGYDHNRTIFMADGSEHIWRLQTQYLPQAEVCLDWYHLIEYIWKAGECVYAEGSDELRAWVGRTAKKLKRGHVVSVLAELREVRRGISKTGPGTKGKRKRLDEVIRYYANNLSRMRYRALCAHDLDIGTGAVEGAVRNLVGIRLDGPGMRWSRQRSERVLYLRCVLLSGLWRGFVEVPRPAPRSQAPRPA